MNPAEDAPPWGRGGFFFTCSPYTSVDREPAWTLKPIISVRMPAHVVVPPSKPPYIVATDSAVSVPNPDADEFVTALITLSILSIPLNDIPSNTSH